MESENKATVRSDHWDNMKGILMLLVVFGHFLIDSRTGKLTSLTVTYIYTFHMPVFVFISGYFGKSERSRSSSSIIRFAFLYILMNNLMGLAFGFEKLIDPVNMMWYLAALIFWRLTAHRIAQFPMIVLLLIFFSLLIGFEPSVGNEFAVSRIIGFFPYYMAGLLLSDEKYKAIAETKRSRNLVVGSLALVIAGAAVVIANKVFVYTDHLLMMNYYMRPESCFGRIVQFIIGFLMIFVFLRLTPHKSIPLVTKFGKYSLPIFLFHRAVTKKADLLFSKLPEPAVFILSIVFTVLICLLFGNSFVSSKLKILTDDAVQLLDGKGEKKKFGPAAVGLILAFGALIAAMLLDAYEGFDISDFNSAGDGDVQ